MKFKYNKIEYEVIQRTSDSIIYTDGTYLYQIDPKTGKGLSNTGKSKADLYRLATAFNPKSITMSPDFLAALQQPANPYGSKVFTYNNYPDLIYVLPQNTNSDPYYDGIIVNSSTFFRDRFHKDKFGTEVDLKIFAVALKKAIITGLRMDEYLSDKFFKI